MPLMACSTDPPRPCQKLDWRSVSETRSGSTADCPFKSGQSSSIAPMTSLPEVKQLPSPESPSSVFTTSSVWRFSCGSCPCGQPPSTVAPESGQTSIALIFTMPLAFPRTSVAIGTIAHFWSSASRRATRSVVPIPLGTT